MPLNSCNKSLRALMYCTIGPVLVGFALPAFAKKKPREDFSVTTAPPHGPIQANGAIFQNDSYSPLTSGMRAARIGDVLTIILAERTNASKSNAANTDRAGDIGLTPPATGPLSAISPSDVNMSGKQSFKGKGNAAQSNALSGEITVTIAALYPNGTMLVRGEKLLTLNRGDEKVQVSGIIRSADISTDNRVLSSRVADAHILYTGKGEVARASQQGWLQRFFSRISPF
jgi:flagellar L-ring protein FlgH